MSYELIFALVFIGLALILTLCVFGLGELIKWQARKSEKRFFAPVPRPGSFSFVVLEGRVVEILENVAGWMIKEITTSSLKKAKCFVLGDREPDFWERYLGVRWIGPFATIKVFPEWKWSEFRQVEEEKGINIPKYEVEARKESVSGFFLQFPYPVILEDAEIAGNIRVRIVAVLIVLHFYPVRAFFLNKDPVALFNAMVQSLLRSYVVDKNFNQVKGTKASRDIAEVAEVEGNTDQTIKENMELWHRLERFNGIPLDDNGVPNYNGKIDPLGLFGKLGFVITRAEVVQVEAVGSAAEAIEAQRIAELKGDAEITKARKTARATVAEAVGNARATRARTAARKAWVEETIVGPTGGPGPQVAAVLEAEQVASETSKVVTWVKGGRAVVAVPPGEPKK